MTPDDPLLQRYREANALDTARPADAVRENVLARARAAAETPAGKARPPAANDAFWRWRALGGLAVLGLASLVVLQFDRGPAEERDAVLAPAAPPLAAPPPVRAPEPAPARETEPAPPVAAKPAARPAPAPPPPPQAPPAPPMAPAPSAPPTAQTQDRRADAVTESAAPARAQARSELRGAPSRELDVNAVDPQGRTALMRAAQQGDAERVRQLIEAGADPLRRDREGRSAADLARAAGHEALLPLLEPGSAPTR